MNIREDGIEIVTDWHSIPYERNKNSVSNHNTFILCKNEKILAEGMRREKEYEILKKRVRRVLYKYNPNSFRYSKTKHINWEIDDDTITIYNNYKVILELTKDQVDKLGYTLKELRNY